MTTNSVTANNLLLLVFNATTWANIAINATGSPATNLYVSLHSADPGAGGTQNTNEIGYTSYGRVAVARTGSGWAVTSNAVSPVSSVTFPTGSGGSGTATFAAIGMLSTGAGIILWSGPISPAIVTGNAVTPALTTASALTIT